MNLSYHSAMSSRHGHVELRHREIPQDIQRIICARLINVIDQRRDYKFDLIN